MPRKRVSNKLVSKTEILRREKISISRIGDKNVNWKGDSVGYKALHEWVAVKIKRPGKCSSCEKTGKVDLANISQKYKRDISDWEWLCRRCHMKKDGRLAKLIKHNNSKKRLGTILCLVCKKTVKQKSDRTKFCSHSCRAIHRTKSKNLKPLYE